MANTIEIVIKATDSASKVISTVESNMTGSTRVITKNLDDMSKAVQSADQRIANFGKGMSSLGNKLSVGLTLPLAAAGAAAIKMGMDMEQTTIAFTSMLGSADAAKKHLEELRDFAAKTPFEFTELTQASKRMMAFGFAAEKVVPMLRDIGDATSALGMGSEGIDRITRALGQMQAKGKVSGEEMMQITEAGIPGWRYLAEAMGVSTAEVMKMSEKGLIPASRAIDAILAGMRQDFGGMMAAQSKTAAGQLSNLKDSIVAVGTSLGEIMLPTVKSAIGIVSTLADTLKNMSPEMQQLVVTTGLLAVSLGPIMKIGGTLIVNFKALKDVFIDVSGSALTMVKSVVDVAGTLQRIGITSYTVEDALIRLRASGALLAGELGVISIGLIAIGKYLEQVGVAAQATNDDLIAMSRSGDVFKQAAATTEIFVHGQERLKVALDATREKIRTGAKDYADYKSSIEATAKAAGYQIDAQGNLVQVFYGAAGATTKLVQANYALIESSYNAYKASMTQAYGIDLLSSAMLRAGTENAKSFDRVNDATARHTQIMKAEANKRLRDVEEYNAKLEAANLKAAAIMQAGYTGDVGKQLKAYSQSQEELKKRAADLEQQIKNFKYTSSSTALSVDELAAAQAKLAKVTEDLNRAQRQKGETDAEYISRLADLRAQQSDLNDKISGAGGVYRDNAQQLSTLKQQLADVTDEIKKNADAHDEAMKRIVLDIAAQQLAADGWTKTEINAFTQIAKQFGVFDQKSADLANRVLGATERLAKDQNAESFAKRLDAALNLATGKTKGTLFDIKNNLEGSSRAMAQDKGAETFADKYTSAMKSVGQYSTYAIQSMFNVTLAAQAMGYGLAALPVLPTMPLPAPTPTTTPPTNGDRRNPDTPGGYQRGGEFIVPPNPRGGNGDYYMAAFAPGERVSVTPANAARESSRVNIGNVSINVGGSNATPQDIEQAVYDGIIKVFNEARAQ